MSVSGNPSTVVMTITGSGMANWRTILTSPAPVHSTRHTGACSRSWR